jgi:hypothetical protein
MDKPFISTGCIGFAMWNNNRISKIMSWFMQSQWSHSFYIWGFYGPYTILAETTDFEITKSTLDKYNNENAMLEIWEPISDINPLSMAAHGQYLEGQVYGYLQLISLGIRRILMRFGIKINNFFRVGAVCTAVPIVHSNMEPGIKCLYRLDPESIDTEELYQLVKNSGEYRMIYKKEYGETW